MQMNLLIDKQMSYLIAELPKNKKNSRFVVNQLKWKTHYATIRVVWCTVIGQPLKPPRQDAKRRLASLMAVDSRKCLPAHAFF